MKKKLVCSIVLALIVSSAMSQTKKIAHNSHSGKDAEFSMEGADNFGISPKIIRWSDSVDKARQRQDSIRIASYKDSVNRVNAKKVRKNKKK